MRNIAHIQRQKGVVLAFSLLILLLVTLVGVNMVQQNRLQFMMAANAQTQSNEFANAESLLTLAEEYIAKQRYTVWPHVSYIAPFTETNPPPDPDPRYTCNKTAAPAKFDQLKPADITGNLNLSVSTKAKATVAITKTSCMIIGTTESECIADKSTMSGWKATEMQCYQTDQAQCITEIYDLNVRVTDSTGAARVIESRYAVRCDK